MSDAPRGDPNLPDLLNEGTELAKFVRNVLPEILGRLQRDYGWSRVSRIIVIDKAPFLSHPRSTLGW